VRGDEQLAAYEIGLVSEMRHLLFGRKTFEQLSFYWQQIPQNPNAADWEKVCAGRMNPLPKTVVSTSLQTADWGDSRIVRDADQVADLKASTEGDILIYGSATLVQALSRLSLIDEYHLLVHPVLLGGGTSLFGALGNRLNLVKTRSEDFESGLVLSVYETQRG